MKQEKHSLPSQTWTRKSSSTSLWSKITSLITRDEYKCAVLNAKRSPWKNQLSFLIGFESGYLRVINITKNESWILLLIHTILTNNNIFHFKKTNLIQIFYFWMLSKQVFSIIFRNIASPAAIAARYSVKKAPPIFP
jgi:hypothetical protein